MRHSDNNSEQRPDIPRTGAISGTQIWDSVDLDQGIIDQWCIFGTRMLLKGGVHHNAPEERIRDRVRDHVMKERRDKERRGTKLALPLVVVDMKGRSRSVDRRRIPDRRLNNIHVEFIPLDVFYNSTIE